MRRIFFFASLVIAILISATASAQPIGIAASNPGSLYHSSASAIAKMANEKAGLQLTVQPFASPTIYLPGVNAGEYAFGLSNIQELRDAVTGTVQFEGRKYDQLRAVAIMYPLRTALFVRKDSPIRSIEDLKGKRVVDGYTGQKTIPYQLAAHYATADMTRKDIQPVPVPNVVAGADAFITGKADAFYFALGSAKVREADASVGGIRALGIPNTPENLAKIKRHFPAAYLRLERPSKVNVGVLEPIHVLAFDGVVVASTLTPEDVVYRLVKAMHENQKEMASVFPVFNLFDPSRMASTLDPIQWHPGTIKFLKEKRMWPPR